MVSRLSRVSVRLRVVYFLMLFIFANLCLSAQTLTVLHSFENSDGQYPKDGLIRDSSGNLYGTTTFGSKAGYGTIFKLDESGKFRVLYRFAGGPDDGAYPNADLVRDKDRNIYGTTWQGGTANGGTIFKLDAAGNEKVLYNFAVNSQDGMWPYAGLIRDAAGNLYGTTSAGGLYGGGIVFKLDNTGKEEVLYNFDGNVGGGMWPGGGPLLRAEGRLYGTTGFGGAFGMGTVFAFHESNATFVTDFGGAGGEFPFAGLVKDSDNIYGTTQFGGNLSCNAQSSGCGTVFKLDSRGNQTVLYSFLGVPDGDDAANGLILDNSGNLFGATPYGGTGACQNFPYSGCGTIFEIDPTGKETVLFNFTGGADGKYPFGVLVRDTKGNLYGTSSQGGGTGCFGNGCGTVFKLTLR
jgi:uncharacterized repeat protein (TIGR03803 family)